MAFDFTSDHNGPGSIYPYTTHIVNFRSLDGKREWTEYFADIADGYVISREEAIGYAFELLTSRIWTEPGSIVVYELTFLALDDIKKRVILKIDIETLPPLVLPINFPLRIGKY